MKFMKMVAAGALVVGALVLGTAASAGAITTSTEIGGTWSYGTCQGGACGTGGIVYSYFYHDDQTHKSTACNNIDCAYSGWVASGYTSIAEWPMTWWGNTAYYDYI